MRQYLNRLAIFHLHTYFLISMNTFNRDINDILMKSESFKQYFKVYKIYYRKFIIVKKTEKWNIFKLR